MTHKDIQAISQAVRKIANYHDRKTFVQNILPHLYDNGPKKFNAVQFCLDCDTPALI